MNVYLQGIGFSLERHSRFPTITGAFDISLVLDVGANSGQFATGLRRSGYKGKIISFEPLSVAHEQLVTNAQKDLSWIAFNRVALGAANTEKQINISQNSYSSSMHKMLSSHTAAAPGSDIIGAELITVLTLDSIFDSVTRENDRILLKIDTQGYEKEVLLGALHSLPLITAVQIELSMTPLYEPYEPYEYFLDFFAENGFILWDLIPGFRDPSTGRLLQFDGIFVKAEKLN